MELARKIHHPTEPPARHGGKFTVMDGPRGRDYPDWLIVTLARHGCYRIDPWKVAELPEFRCRCAGAPSAVLLNDFVREFEGRLIGACDEKILRFYDEGLVRLPACKDWSRRSLRAAVIKTMLDALQKKPCELEYKDFEDSRLMGLSDFYGDSPYAAVRDAGFGLHPWEMKTTPTGFYTITENRVKATRWLVRQLGKKPREILYADFADNGFGAVLNYHKGSQYAALAEAGYKVKPWEMEKAPQGFYKVKGNRAEATRWLVKTLGRKPGEVTSDNFEKNGLQGVMNHHKGSAYAALREAGYRVKPWEMSCAPNGFYNGKANRVGATRWLVAEMRKEGKKPREITTGDFEGQLRGLLAHTSHSAYMALREAGYRILPWRASRVPRSLKFFEERENRIGATIWLADKMVGKGIAAREITATHFQQNHLSGMLRNHYGDSPFGALHDAGLVKKSDEKHMRSPGHAHLLAAA